MKVYVAANSELDEVWVTKKHSEIRKILINKLLELSITPLSEWEETPTNILVEELSAFENGWVFGVREL